MMVLDHLTRRAFQQRALLGTAALATGSSYQAIDNKTTHLLAGAAETVATPTPKGTFLIGPMKPSTGVHDDLYARALVLADRKKPIALVTLDYLGFDFAYTRVLIQAISKASGIPIQHVMLNCSHTHSAPLTAPWGPWEKKKDSPFHKELPKRVAGVVKEALRQLQPARLYYRREPTQVGFNRRLYNGNKVVMAPNPQGAILPWVDVLSVESQDRQPIAVLFSHAAHPVIVHSASTLISADYPGFAVQTLRQARGKKSISLFAQGCCGNINGFPLQGGLDGARAAGRDLGKAVLRGLRRPDEEIATDTLQIVSSEIQLPLQPPPSPAECKALMQKEKKAERKQRFADLLTIAKSKKVPSMRFPIRGLTLGERFCLLGLPHEPFAEYHHHINKVSPFAHTMVLGYTNGLECYVGTARDYQLGERGGYETSPRGAAFMFESRLPLDAKCEGLIHAATARLLKKLKAS